MHGTQLKPLHSLARRKAFWGILASALFVWASNTSLFVDRSDRRVALVAHGALGQTYDLTGVKWNTNTATIIHPLEHPYIDNTLPSMRAAFAGGADVVEFDIRLTGDRQLAVFHDDILEYRTDGTGPVSAKAMEYLRTLDVGYGYTAAGGRTFPLRGTGLGLMVSIADVVREFPDGTFLIHIKDSGNEVGPVLLEYLGTLSERQIANISLYGNDNALDLIPQRYPTMKTLSMRRIKRALLGYELVGWTGYILSSIRNMEMHLRLEYARLLWGWPDRFLQRMDAAHTRVVLVRYVDGWSDGFDTEAELARLPPSYTGSVWTNRVDIVAPLLRKISENYSRL